MIRDLTQLNVEDTIEVCQLLQASGYICQGCGGFGKLVTIDLSSMAVSGHIACPSCKGSGWNLNQGCSN